MIHLIERLHTMANATESSTRAVHNAVQQFTYALTDTLGLTDAQQGEVRDATVELVGSILDQVRREAAMR